MNRLFVSYRYIAKSNGQIYEGFENMVGHRLMFPPQDEEHIDIIEDECRKHCVEKLGAETASATLITWKVMDGK